MLKRYLFRFYRWLSGINFWFRERFTPAGLLALASLIVSGIIGLDGNFTIGYQIFWFLACLLAVSVAWGLLSRARFAAARHLPRFGTVGTPIQYIVSLRNGSRRPQQHLQVSEARPDPRPTLQQFLRTPEPGENKRNWFDRLGGHYRWRWLLERNVAFENSSVTIPFIAGAGAAAVTQSLTPQKRGVLQLPGLVVTWTDPFGLFRGRCKVPCPQSVLILPKRFRVKPAGLPGTVKYQPGGIALAGSVGQSEEFVSLRDYRPGDPVRHIHWRSWARQERPIVKEFLDEFFVRHALVLDTFVEPEEEDVFEEAVSVAASFACTIPDQESLLDLMFVGPEAYCFTSGRGVAPPERMLEILAAVSPCREHSIEALERLLLRHIAQVTSCVLVLVRWDEARQQLVETLKVLGVPVQVFVVRPSGDTAPLDSGPLKDCAHNLRKLTVGRIPEAFACG